MPTVWAGYLADKLIAATPRRIVALELGQGTVQWKYDAVDAGKDQDQLDPFARANDPGPGARRLNVVNARVTIP